MVALVNEAERAWRNSNSALAEEKLDLASRITNATELTPIRRLHTRMANAKVESLVTEASWLASILASAVMATDWWARVSA